MANDTQETCHAGALLDAWMAEGGITHDQLVARINARRAEMGLRGEIQRSNVWRWRMGRQRPDIDHSVILAEITGGRVSVSDWTTGAAGRAAESDAPPAAPASAPPPAPEAA